MTRVLLALALGLAAVSQAQIVRPMGETPGDLGPTQKTIDEPSTTPKVASPKRFSSFSAGRGGPLFAFSQIVDGMVVGGMMGVGISGMTEPLALSQGAYLGAIAGGVGLGGLAVLLQYFQPIGLVAAGAATLGIAVGALAGLGTASLLSAAIPGLPLILPGLLALVGSQVGALVPLALLWSAEDLDAADLALMGAGSLHAVLLTGLFTFAVGRELSAPAMLLAPAAGMAISGLVAALTRFSAGAVLLHATPALGLGLLAFFVTAAATGSLQGGGIAGLGAMAVSVGVTALVAAATGAPPEPSSTVTPSVLVLPPAPGAALGAVGPALRATF